MAEFLIALILTAAGALVWRFAASRERERFKAKLRELESKARLSQAESANLRDQIVAMRAETAQLQKFLEDERTSKSEALGRLAATFKKGIVWMAAAYFVSGVAIGGFAGWPLAAWQMKSRDTLERAKLELESRLGQVKSELLDTQMRALQAQVESLRGALESERVEKTVALTKLQILLESLSADSGEGFRLDYEKLKKNLRQHIAVPPANRFSPA